MNNVTNISEDLDEPYKDSGKKSTGTIARNSPTIGEDGNEEPYKDSGKKAKGTIAEVTSLINSILNEDLVQAKFKIQELLNKKLSDSMETRFEEYAPTIFESKGEKPDFLDLDGDGNTEESMKDAAEDAKEGEGSEDDETKGKKSHKKEKKGKSEDQDGEEDSEDSEDEQEEDKD